MFRVGTCGFVLLFFIGCKLILFQILQIEFENLSSWIALNLFWKINRFHLFLGVEKTTLLSIIVLKIAELLIPGNLIWGYSPLRIHTTMALITLNSINKAQTISIHSRKQLLQNLAAFFRMSLTEIGVRYCRIRCWWQLVKILEVGWQILTRIKNLPIFLECLSLHSLFSSIKVI